MLCDVAQANLYARISQVNKDWLRATARDAGLSDTVALDAILDEARGRNWSLRPSPPQVIQP